MNEVIEQQLKDAKQASREMLTVSGDVKNKALKAISDALKANVNVIVEENQKDIADAKNNGIKESMIDRLLLNEKRIISIADDVLKVIDLKNPVGEIIRTIDRPNGLHIEQVRIPIGVIAVIYESRPNVTVDIASLCIKTNNVPVLKGGKEAIHSNRILVKIMSEAIKDILPEHVITLVEATREETDQILKANKYIDVVIPRGGAGLIKHVVTTASVPVIETGAGVCHLYIDKDADMKKAIDIAVNAKIQRPSVCNAIECILVHKDVAKEFFTLLKDAFDCVTIKGDSKVREIINCDALVEEDYAVEYDDYIVNTKIVNNVEEAIDHIFKYSTQHSECIVTENKDTAELFMNALDSACVYWNASTRFSDGGEFGFGAEVGISTQKLHARGPLGLQEICSFKYKIYGNGQIRK